MNILDAINAPSTKLTKSDQVLLQYVKTKGLDACSSPISEIARSCGVSHATVTRFARKFGFDSLRSFKIALAQEIGSQDSEGHLISVHITYDEDSETTAKKLSKLVESTIKQTASEIDHSSLIETTNQILGAQRVFFMGKGNSGFVAQDSAYKFFRIGIDARAVTDTHDIVIQGTLLKNSDLVVLISNSGETPELIQAALKAKEIGATVVVITAQSESHLAHEADELLTYAIRESSLDTGSIYSKISVFFIIDLLYTEICKRLQEEAVNTKQLTTNAIHSMLAHSKSAN